MPSLSREPCVLFLPLQALKGIAFWVIHRPVNVFPFTHSHDASCADPHGDSNLIKRPTTERDSAHPIQSLLTQADSGK